MTTNGSPHTAAGVARQPARRRPKLAAACSSGKHSLGMLVSIIHSYYMIRVLLTRGAKPPKEKIFFSIEDIFSLSSLFFCVGELANLYLHYLVGNFSCTWSHVELSHGTTKTINNRQMFNKIKFQKEKELIATTHNIFSD